ncbi:MAG: hypothetical protein WC455_10580 [Dehalococcoidia bacterium]|jgi:hypothetical protein
MNKELKGKVLSALSTAMLKSFDLGPSQADQVYQNFKRELEKIKNK